MLLTCVFTRAQPPVDGHRKDEKCLATTKRTFFTMGLKLQGHERKGKKKKREEEEKKKKKEEKKEQEKTSSSLEG